MGMLFLKYWLLNWCNFYIQKYLFILMLLSWGVTWWELLSSTFLQETQKTLLLFVATHTTALLVPKMSLLMPYPRFNYTGFWIYNSCFRPLCKSWKVVSLQLNIVEEIYSCHNVLLSLLLIKKKWNDFYFWLLSKTFMIFLLMRGIKSCCNIFDFTVPKIFENWFFYDLLAPVTM